MNGCESWTIKKAEHWRIDAFELWCWRILLRIPWTARIYNQSILKEINPEYSLQGLMLNLQYFGHLRQRADSLLKTLMLERLKAGGEGDDRGWDGWMASSTWWTWVWASSGSWWCEDAWHSAVHGVAKTQTQLRDWTEYVIFILICISLIITNVEHLSTYCWLFVCMFSLGKYLYSY